MKVSVFISIPLLMIFSLHISNIVLIIIKKLYKKTMHVFLINLIIADILQVGFTVIDHNVHANHMLVSGKEVSLLIIS